MYSPIMFESERHPHFETHNKLHIQNLRTPLFMSTSWRHLLDLSASKIQESWAL